jgi:hypothetical protein
MAQALDEQLGGDGVDLLRRDGGGEAVHQVAPGPEAVWCGVGRTRGAFRQAPEGALKRVRMQVDHAGQDILHSRHTGSACADLGERAVRIPRDAHISRPAIRQQRVTGQ